MDQEDDPHPLPLVIATAQQQAAAAASATAHPAPSPHELKLAEAHRALLPVIATNEVPTCPAANVPSTDRELTEKQRREALSAVIAACMQMNPFVGLRQRCASTPPVVLRAQVVQGFTDIQLLAMLVALLMYDERSYEMLLCNSVNPRLVESVVLERFIVLMWHGNFQLRLDNDFLYFFDVSESRFAISLSNISSHITLEVLRELVRRYHLWRGTLSSDQTYVKMDGFVYNPEFRAMMDRSVLMSRFVAYYLNNQCTTKRMEELRNHTLTVQRIATMGQLARPLSTRENEALETIVRMLSADVADCSKLSPFTHPNDSKDIPEVVREAQQQQQLRKEEEAEVDDSVINM